MESESNTYTVTLYSSRLFFPLWLVVHTHFTVENNGIASRFEVFGRIPSSREKAIDGYLYRNVLPSEEGLFIIWAKNAVTGFGPRWKTKKHHHITGGEGSLACKMYRFFEEGAVQKYPYTQTYNMFKGPNSNTFTQWVIDQFPESEFRLPTSAFGKRYGKSSPTTKVPFKQIIQTVREGVSIFKK